MTPELPDGNLPDDAAQDQVHPLLTPTGEVDDSTLEKTHEQLLPRGSALTADDETKLEAIKRFRAYKHGKHALKVQSAHLRQEPVRTEGDRNLVYRRKRP